MSRDQTVDAVLGIITVIALIWAATWAYSLYDTGYNPPPTTLNELP